MTAARSGRLRPPGPRPVHRAPRTYTQCVPPAVHVSGLAKRYGGVVALDGATWQASAGAVTAVLGPNGAGKTTMVECCEGLRRPDGGQVRVLGTDPWNASPEHRARVGVMLQDGGLPASARPAPAAAPPRARCMPRRRRSTRSSSGSGSTGSPAPRCVGCPVASASGWRSAAALVGRPEVAFLDEPSAGLDPHARLDVWELVRSLADDGVAVVLTTHSFEEAERLADHIVVVAGGAVVAEGSLADVTGATGSRTATSRSPARSVA